MNQNIRRKLVIASVVLASLAASVVADSTSLQEKLAQDIEIELTDVTMAEALSQIGTQAGITIELTDGAAWKLPAGEQTRLSVTLEGQLAQGLEQMLNEFLLRYAVGSESVVVVPRPELDRVLGRPTARLLTLLKNIYTNKMSLNTGGHTTQLAQILINTLADEEVTLLPMREFDNASAVIANIARRTPSGAIESSTTSATPVTLATILEETIGGRSGTVWYVSEPEFTDQPLQIHIDSRLDYGRACFGQVVDVSFQNEEGLTVLRKLAAMANVNLEFPDEGRPWSDGTWLHQRISLDALNVTVREALNRVTVALGAQVGTVNFERASFEVIAPVDAVRRTPTQRVSEPSGSGNAAPEAAAVSDDDYVGKISIPMGEGENRYYIEFMLRERDLPEALRRLRAEKIREIFESFSSDAETEQ